MDQSRFDRWTRRRVGVLAGLAIAVPAGWTAADAKPKRRKKKRKKRPSCGACADNEECVSGRCVSLARICVIEDDSCTTGEPLLCGDENDPVEARASCQLTLGGNPICARQRSISCRACTAHDDCRRQGWGPRGVCLATCRIRCGVSGPPSCGLPYGEACRAPGESCFADVDCCSQRCEAGVCRLAPPFCGNASAVCKEHFECCSGECGWPQDPFCSS